MAGKMKGLKSFSPEETIVKTVYVTKNHYKADVDYKLQNGNLKINMIGIIRGILKEQGISGFKAKNAFVSVPFNLDQEVIEGIMSLVVNKKRFTIRLPDMQGRVSKVKKLDYDNVHPHRWNKHSWMGFLAKKFFEYYDFVSSEMDVDSLTEKKRGISFGKLNNMRETLYNYPKQKFTDKDILEYIDWAFKYKGAKLTISLGLLGSPVMIQDWIHWRKKGHKVEKRTKRKWDD